MYDWEEMAIIVGRKLVQNGQSRILQRIHDGVTSNWVLDVADDKSSINHHLIHLVWRKFPRNQHPSEERRPTAVSTQTDEQTDEGSSAVLGLDTSAGLSRPPRKILEKDCYSSSDLGNLFETKINTSCSDAGSSSDCCSSGLAERELTSYDYSPENTTFIPPPRRRSGKPLFKEKIFQPELTNRFDCFQEVSSPEISNVNTESKDQQLTNVSQRIRPPTPPKMKTRSNMQEIPKTLFAKSIGSPLTSAIPTTSTQEVDSSKLRRKESPTTSKIKENDIEDKKRYVGTVDGLGCDFGTLIPDFCLDRSKTHLFKVTVLHKEIGLREGDMVTYTFRPSSGVGSCDVMDVQCFDNG